MSEYNKNNAHDHNGHSHKESSHKDSGRNGHNGKNGNCDNSLTCTEGHTFKAELMHHLPYAIFSLAFAMIILSLLDYSNAFGTACATGVKNSSVKGYRLLFHSFHFMHILFASTGAIITFARYSKSLFKAILVGTISPAFFCILSDVLLPYVAGTVLGVNMDLHICFHKEIHNILPFLFAGALNGLILRGYHRSLLEGFSVSSHFVHILISSLASLFYMVSHGFANWYPQMGYVFLFLLVAIVVPCTLSDVVVPMYFARGAKPEDSSANSGNNKSE